jgi:hypothetical protein
LVGLESDHIVILSSTYFFPLTLSSENHYLFIYFSWVSYCHCRKEKKKN